MYFFQYAQVMTLCHSFLQLKFCPCCLIYVLANELNFNDSTLESPYFGSLHTRRQLMLSNLLLHKLSLSLDEVILQEGCLE